MPSSTINRGNVATTILITLTLTPAAVATVTAGEQTFNVGGLLAIDQVSAISPQFPWTSLTSIAAARVVSPGVLGVSFSNGTGGSLTPPAGVYLLEINRPESLPLPASAV